VRSLHPAAEEIRPEVVPEEPEPAEEEPTPIPTENIPEEPPTVEGLPMSEEILHEAITSTTVLTEEPELLPSTAEIDGLPLPRPRDQSTLVSASDPIAAYRRRSSILQSSVSPNTVRGSTMQHQTFPTTAGNDSAGEGSYIVPARSRAASIMSGQSQLLRTLSTFSIHEKMEPEIIKQFVGIAPTAEAPPSSMPLEFVTSNKDKNKEGYN